VTAAVCRADRDFRVYPTSAASLGMAVLALELELGREREREPELLVETFTPAAPPFLPFGARPRGRSAEDFDVEEADATEPLQRRAASAWSAADIFLSILTSSLPSLRASSLYAATASSGVL